MLKIDRLISVLSKLLIKRINPEENRIVVIKKFSKKLIRGGCREIFFNISTITFFNSNILCIR